MNNIRKWIVPIFIVIGVVAMEESRNASADERWNAKYTFHIQYISELIDQYTHHRMETGVWPDQKQLYGAFFHLRQSTSIANGREVVFSDSSFGRTWLQFSLTDNGHVSATILRDAPAGISN